MVAMCGGFRPLSEQNPPHIGSFGVLVRPKVGGMAASR